MSEQILINGIDALTGKYLPAPGTDTDLAERVVPSSLSPKQKRELRWWVERYGINDPHRAPVVGVDVKNLASAGWCVVFAPDVSPEVREALQPLLSHRKAQAGGFYKEIVCGREPSKIDFIGEQKAPPGPADPRFLPYYVLIVGDPRTIPFRFQYDLDVQYAVGRLWLETPADYERYARSVVQTEAGERRRPKRITLFGVANKDDRATHRTSRELIEPLSKVLGDHESWEVIVHLGEEATKERLGSLLGGADTPAFLFTASHGLGFSVEPESLSSIWERQSAEQGALVCQDWPGPVAWSGAIPREHYFAASDLASDADLLGLVAFHFACYGAGTPEVDGFSDEPLGQPAPIALSPFVARLPQQLLSRGALAVVSHVDRAWTTSFSWTEEGQVSVFENTFKALLQGHPVGSAMEVINQRHAELAVDLDEMHQRRVYRQPYSQQRFARLWRANNDARNFVVLGDPAVRLTFRESPFDVTT